MTEELKNEQTAIKNAQPAEAEGSSGANENAVSYGKFKDAEALLAAYNSLQAEFTRRCQRLKELEEKSAETADKDKAEKDKTASDAKRFLKTDPVPESDKFSAANDLTSDEKNAAEERAKEEILKEYLKSIAERKTGAIIMDGIGASVKTPRVRPKTVEEAGKLFSGFIG